MTNSKLLRSIFHYAFLLLHPTTRNKERSTGPNEPIEIRDLGHGRRYAYTITIMSYNMDDKASNESINGSDRSPEVLTTISSDRTTSTGGVKRFASAAMEKALRRSNAYTKRVK